MAPTEILAEQHYRTLTTLLAKVYSSTAAPMRVELLTGSLTGAARSARVRYEAIAAGEVDVAVGTHALIQEGVSFRNLGIAVVDEQHRFGVMQRAALRERMVARRGRPDDAAPARDVGHADPAHARADPLRRPRRLGDRRAAARPQADQDDVGRPGRARPRPTTSCASRCEQGRQAFVVCPLIEESDDARRRAPPRRSTSACRPQVFPDLRLGLLHGRMSGAEKDACCAPSAAAT